MGLNINALKAKFIELNSNSAAGRSHIWKPEEGKNVIRILPRKNHTDNPFIELYIHGTIGKGKYVSPITFGERDPIEEFGQTLRGEGGLSKEDWLKTRDFFPYQRTYVPIIVRGKESEGVKYWAFGKTVYSSLISFMTDSEYGDITDPQEGRDLTVEYVPQKKSDTGFAKTTFRVSPKQSPVSADAAVVKTLLSEQPDLMEAFTIVSYDELKGILESYLNPTTSPGISKYGNGNTADDAKNDSDVVESDEDAKIKEIASVSAKTSKRVTTDFEDVFNK